MSATTSSTRPSQRGKHKRQNRGAPVLPVTPFLAWLAQYVAQPPPHIAAQKSIPLPSGDGFGEWTKIAEAIGVTDRALYRWRFEPGETHVSERVVEQAGLQLAGNPRLAAQLYPHLSEPVCGICRQDACAHLGEDLADDGAYWAEQFPVAA